jgi:hypothetical protein
MAGFASEMRYFEGRKRIFKREHYFDVRLITAEMF